EKSNCVRFARPPKRASTISIKDKGSSLRTPRTSTISSIISQRKSPAPKTAKASPVLDIVIAAAARRDIRDILSWSEDNFGAAARERYQFLIGTAIKDLAQNAYRPG